MTSTKSVEVWKLLEKYRFTLETDQMVGVSCSICKDIMIDPYIAFCGCQYCFKCIKNDLRAGNRCCPSRREECVANCLEIGKNVVMDVRASLNILNLMVRCPHDLCSYTSELSNMNEHVRVCTVRPVSCPYESIGCTDAGLEENTEKMHQEIYMTRHSQLLVEAINHLRNDVDALKQTDKKREIEINELKEEARTNKEEIERLNEENRTKETSIEEMKDEVNVLKTEINVLRQSYVNTEREKMTTTEEWKEKYEENVKYINTQINQCSEEIDTMKSRLMKLFPIIKEDFLWTIDDFSEKRGYYYSEPFYKDNYKLIIGAKHGDLFLTLYLHVIPGENDDEAQWPMKNDITMTIHLDALKICEEWKCDYDEYKYDKSVFDRQTCINNAGIYLGLISIDDINQITQSLAVSSPVLISCTVHSIVTNET